MLVVGYGELSCLCDLGPKNSRSGDGQSSLNVDHLGKGSSHAAKSGSSEENVAHVEGCLVEMVMEKKS